ncbi:hypothetical protein, partial [Coleofasciculus sp. LEGE 07092]|uniref:hypothetical protein n=1 Tax=Coleofasciculus sp. LEGE 07092 TaxID=2777969 RepID=UPI00187F7C7D
PLVPPSSSSPSIPFEDELKIRGVNLLDPRIHKAIASSSDPYLSIKAWLEWSSTQVVESPTGSLLTALRSGWRPRNMDERPRRTVIPDLPPELSEWAKQKRSIIQQIIWSDLEKQWVVFLHGEPPLPAVQAMSLFP